MNAWVDPHVNNNGGLWSMVAMTVGGDWHGVETS